MSRLSEPVQAVSSIGIDPGYSGAIALVYVRGGSRPKLLTVKDMPDTPADLIIMLANLDSEMPPDVCEADCFLERVHAMPGQGVSSTFKFGRNYGSIETALCALDIPYTEVTPRVWQKAVGISPKKKGETKTAFKKRIRARAVQLYPSSSRVITVSNADAVLIAHYGLRVLTRLS